MDCGYCGHEDGKSCPVCGKGFRKKKQILINTKKVVLAIAFTLSCLIIIAECLWGIFSYALTGHQNTDPTLYSIGSTVNDGEFSYKITNISHPKNVPADESYYNYFEEKIIVTTLEVTNISNKAIKKDFDIVCYTDNIEYDYDWDLSIDTYDKALSSGKTAVYNFYFIIPKDSKNVEFSIFSTTFNWFGYEEYEFKYKAK